MTSTMMDDEDDGDGDGGSDGNHGDINNDSAIDDDRR